MNSIYEIPINPAWLKGHLIFLTKFGSKAYGTSLPDSDTDLRGVCTLPKNIIYGFSENFEQTQCREPYDLEIFSLIKFARLAVDSNPNVLEFLFVDRESIVFTTSYWEQLLSIRDCFLSKRIAFTFAGYAKSQLHKIRTHRSYLLNPVKEIPTREQFGLPARALVPKLHASQAIVQKQLDTVAGDWSLDKTEQMLIFKDTAAALGFDTNFVELLYREKQYGARVAEKAAYDNWAKSRNPKRRMLEEKCGYDSKHLMHLVRLYRECIECLTTGTLQVKRPDAEELIQIRQGTWPFEKIEEWATNADLQVKEAIETTKLPNKPNLKAIESVVQSIVESGCNSNGEFGKE